ncbi:DUF443 family protein [Oceanobacillus jeddahense]|uniref:DUF443 domain-containing protein n=1 Tax=Oceanobacillus jeddahense TaxID=1462527 RepID=A0ABY5JYB7_9BACI|nr:DUF443 family protein [Oceanobacillus jeddahense]UUI05220.1 DUF443 domain-containing protein [Oceanobacillus jeddahense]
MKSEVKHLANNERYRILIIDGETYIIDIESSFWKIIFPFFFWMVPNSIFKVEDQEIVEQLQTETMEKKGILGVTSIAGGSYAVAISLAPLMEYFNVPMSPIVNTGLMLLAIILVGIWFGILRRHRKQKMYEVIELEKMPEKKLWITPSSIKHFLYVVFAYVFLIALDIFAFWAYVETKNVVVLIIASGFLFLFLITNRKTIREGYVTVKIKN